MIQELRDCGRVSARSFRTAVVSVCAFARGQKIAKDTGVSVNTLLSRKRYAVLRLRERLQGIYNEFMGKA